MNNAALLYGNNFENKKSFVLFGDFLISTKFSIIIDIKICFHGIEVQ